VGEEVQPDSSDARTTTNKIAHSKMCTTSVCKEASSPTIHSWPLWMCTEGPCTSRTNKALSQRHNS